MHVRKGVAVSDGVAIGPAFVFRAQEAPGAGPDRGAATGTAAREAFAEAVESVRARLRALRERAAREAGEAEAAIFDAHLLMLDDPMLQEEVGRRLESGQPLGQAVDEAIEELAGMLAALDDPYMRQRAADVRDLGGQLRRAIRGVAAAAPFEGLVRPSIVVAEDLTPSDTVSLPRAQVLAIVTEAGGPTSHTAILARAMGVPAIVGAGPGLLDLAEGRRMGVDAREGVVYVDPDEATLERLSQAMRDEAGAAARRAALRALPAETVDGFRVELAANLGHPSEAGAAVAQGAEGVGLFRTEFLFLDRAEPPTEDEQVRAYREVLERMGARPVIFRTLDVGGDKPLPFLPVEGEANPFLGYRAIRLLLDRPEIFQAQLRALMRAGLGRFTERGEPQARIMFPMVATLDDLRACRRAFEDAWRAVAPGGDPAAERSRPLFGIMVEIPAAALMMDVLAREVDFVSIGTNDLTQYTLAVDRTNPRVASRADALDPALLRLMHRAIAACREAGAWVGVCGEAGGDPAAIPFFVAAGVNELSMSPGRLPAAKERVRSLDRRDLARRLEDALNAGTAEEVRRIFDVGSP